MRGSISSKPNINPVSNKLIDILDDKEKTDSMNENYHYRQSVLPRLEKLMKIIDGDAHDGKDHGFVHDLRYDLKDNPHHRLRPLEMKKCNDLWKKYKN